MAEKTLNFESPRALSELYADNAANLAEAEKLLGVKLVTRDDWLKIEGDDPGVERAEMLFATLDKGRNQGLRIHNNDFAQLLQKAVSGQDLNGLYGDNIVLKLKAKSIVPKTVNQKNYLVQIRNKTIVFGIGPAGTGKTFLAVASALNALQQGHVERIILTRPAVEAGEALGFLPGDLKEKIQPYLTPLYDAMYQMLGKETADRLIDRGTVEIAPLAYMRGRTLDNAFIILDEAQNTTPEQMMMFLTRLGENGSMVITGDITQVDLPHTKQSGLRHAHNVLYDISDIGFVELTAADVVRHPIVQKIINAYEKFQRTDERVQRHIREQSPGDGDGNI